MLQNLLRIYSVYSKLCSVFLDMLMHDIVFPSIYVVHRKLRNESKIDIESVFRFHASKKWFLEDVYLFTCSSGQTHGFI